MGQLTDRQKQIVLGGGLYNREIAEGVMATQSVKLLYLPLEVDNIGNGAATTFSIGLYIPPYSPEKHPRCFSLARSLRAGEKIRIAIYSENILQDNTGEYELCVCLITKYAFPSCSIMSQMEAGGSMISEGAGRGSFVE